MQKSKAAPAQSRRGDRWSPTVFVSGAAYALIQAFKTVFLMQGAVCKFEPSCSRYAQEAIRKLPAHVAVIKIIWRILRCNPLSKGGFDPVVK